MFGLFKRYRSILYKLACKLYFIILAKGTYMWGSNFPRIHGQLTLTLMPLIVFFYLRPFSSTQWAAADLCLFNVLLSPSIFLSPSLFSILIAGHQPGSLSPGSGQQ